MHLVQNGRLGLAKDRKSQGSTWKRSTCCSQMRNFHFTIDTFLWLEISKTPEHISSGGRKVLHIKPHPEVSKICWRGSRQGRAFWGVHPRVANCVSAKHGLCLFLFAHFTAASSQWLCLTRYRKVGMLLFSNWSYCYFPTGRTIAQNSEDQLSPKHCSDVCTLQTWPRHCLLLSSQTSDSVFPCTCVKYKNHK